MKGGGRVDEEVERRWEVIKGGMGGKAPRKSYSPCWRR
jgi:hypothetical protein